MIKRTVAAVWIVSTLIFAFAGVAGADAPFVTLLPGSRAEYRMDYRGDGTPITVAVDVSEGSGVTMWVYTPEQVEQARRGEQVAPIGRGALGRGHTLYWSGAFRVPGVYRAYVENGSAAPVLYRIEITGGGLNSVYQLQSPTPQAPAAISADGGRRFLTVSLPPGSTAPEGDAVFSLRLPLPAEPKTCVHSNQVKGILRESIKLCPNEIYPPLTVSGNNIGIFADEGRTSVITSAGRQFGISLEGSNNWVEGVTIQARADPVDLGAWLCLYDECIVPTRPLTTTLRGGIRYGGGILLKGSNTTVHGVTVRGGTIGIATVQGRSNYLIENRLSDLNGWGSFNVSSVASYFVGNELNRDNHGCTTLDGRKFLHGCETAGWVCLGCSSNVIARNRCELSANCYYMSGERGLASNDNKLVANFCAGATDNCFEITFARGNILRDNVTMADARTGAACKYPYWVGGSIVYFQNNTWECSIGEDDALAQARDSTPVQTGILPLAGLWVAPSVPRPTVPPATLAAGQPPRNRLGRGAAEAGTPLE